MRVVDSLVDSLDLCRRELVVLAIFEEARPQRAEAQLLAFKLMTRIAVAPVLGPGRIIGEAAAVAALCKLLALLPVAHQDAVGGVLYGGLLARENSLGYGHGRRVTVLAARLLRLVLYEPRLPFRRGARPARFDRCVHVC